VPAAAEQALNRSDAESVGGEQQGIQDNCKHFISGVMMTTNQSSHPAHAKPSLIGLVSHAPGSGKSAIAEILDIYHGFICEPFARPVKECALGVLINAGVLPADAEEYLYENKAEVIPELGVTGRHILQTLGTDWGQRKINRRLWLLCWENTYQIYLNARYHPMTGVHFPELADLRVVADDVRFPDEADTILRLGGQLWEIVRPGTPRHYPLPEWLSWASRLIPRRWRSRFHASEGRLRNYPRFNLRIVNDGSLDDLEATINFLLKDEVHQTCPSVASVLGKADHLYSIPRGYTIYTRGMYRQSRLNVLAEDLAKDLALALIEHESCATDAPSITKAS
jgi:hypothetical protein